jgi:hypothetical protein
MTDEERQKELITFLRSRGRFDVSYLTAADEIERLAKELNKERLLRLSDRYPDVPGYKLEEMLK